ncbi:MAG: hypothetical protein LBQ22_11290 [Bacteroidales bacterium]|jgi:hypothetical protein|nr:hypothetical protein [Bacteroidales bacterium]
MEIKPNKIKKFNKPVFGLALGILTPFICFLIYFLYLKIKGEGLDLSEFIVYLKSSEVLVPVISVCVLPNLILYLIFKKLDYWYAIKGVVASVLVYTLAVFVIKFI